MLLQRSVPSPYKKVEQTSSGVFQGYQHATVKRMA